VVREIPCRNSESWSQAVITDYDLRFLEMFKSRHFQDLSLSEWLTHTPPELVMAHLNIDKATWDAIPKEAHVVMPA